MCKSFIEECPKCHELRKLTCHHVFPRRWWMFWTGRQRRQEVYVCRECHNEIEAEICRREEKRRRPLPAREYIEILETFLSKAA